MVIGRSVVASLLSADDNLNDLHALTVTAALSPGHWAARNYTGLQGTPGLLAKHGSAAHSAVGLYGLAGNPSPGTGDGGIMLSRVFLHESATITGSVTVRGQMRGFWHFLHPSGARVNDGDTFSGTGDLAGRTFLILKPAVDSLGVYVIETTTWESN